METDSEMTATTALQFSTLTRQTTIVTAWATPVTNAGKPGLLEAISIMMETVQRLLCLTHLTPAVATVATTALCMQIHHRMISIMMVSVMPATAMMSCRDPMRQE